MCPASQLHPLKNPVMAIVSTVFGLAEEVIYPRLSDHLRVAVKKRGVRAGFPG